jgi:hypothetical protein
MARTKDLRNNIVRFIDKAKMVATEKNASVDLVMESMQAAWAMEAEFEREENEAKAAESEERAVALRQFSEVVRPFKEAGTRPSGKQIAEQLGLRPTRSNLGWVAHQLRIAYQPSAQAAE